MTPSKKLPNPPKKDYVRFIPLGGLDEVGMNCAIIECNGSMLMIDCGLTFPETGDFGVDIIVPDWAYVLDNLDRLDGLIITHGHEDHIGAAPFFLREVDVPVYAGRLTQGFLHRKLQSHGIGDDVELVSVEAGDVLEIGPFSVEFIHVNHSVPNAMAVALHTPLGTLVFTGDWKVDHTPLYERPTDLTRFAQLGEGKMLALFGDSTNADVPGFSVSETEVQKGFVEVLENAPGRVIVAQFSSNLHRLAGNIALAERFGRKVLLLGTSLLKNSNIARDLGFLPVSSDDLFIKPHEIGNYRPDQILVISTGSQAEPRSSLSRMAFGDHRNIDIVEGDTVVLSARQIPGNEMGINSMINSLLKRGARVITARDAPIHASGHGKREEMKLLINLTKPEYLIPVHGEFRMRKAHAELGRSLGVDQALMVENGDVLQITDKGAEVIGRVQHGRLLVDGRSVGDTEDFQLRDRRKLANAGIIVAFAVLDHENGELTQAPELLQRGVVGPADGEDIMANAAMAAQAGVEALSRDARRDLSEVREAIRVHVRRYIQKSIDRRPVVIPIVHEL